LEKIKKIKRSRRGFCGGALENLQQDLLIF